MQISTRDFPKNVTNFGTALIAAQRYKPWRDDKTDHAWRPLTSSRKRHLACRISQDRKSVDFKLYNTVVLTYHEDESIDLDIISHATVSTSKFINCLTPGSIMVAAQMGSGVVFFDDNTHPERGTWAGDDTCAVQPHGGVLTLERVCEVVKVDISYTGQHQSYTHPCFKVKEGARLNPFVRYTIDRKVAKQVRDATPGFNDFMLWATAVFSMKRLTQDDLARNDESYTPHNSGRGIIPCLADQRQWMNVISMIYHYHTDWGVRYGRSTYNIGHVRRVLLDLIYRENYREHDLVVEAEHTFLYGYNTVRSTLATRQKLMKYT